MSEKCDRKMKGDDRLKEGFYLSKYAHIDKLAHISESFVMDNEKDGSCLICIIGNLTS